MHSVEKLLPRDLGPFACPESSLSLETKLQGLDHLLSLRRFMPQSPGLPLKPRGLSGWVGEESESKIGSHKKKREKKGKPPSFTVYPPA